MVAGAAGASGGILETAQNLFGQTGLPLWVFNVLAGTAKAGLILGFVLINVLFLIWLERKVSAAIQNRVGPLYVGPKGLLQTMADAIKLLSKEDIVPSGADRWVFALAPIVMFAPALMVFVVLPFGPNAIVRDLNIGVLYVAVLTSFTVIAFLMAGWGSNNKWSMLGAMRSGAQLVSYEVPLALSVIGVVMLAGSLRLGDIIDVQRAGLPFIILQPLGFLVYAVAALAELNRAPFDLPEAEQELVAGFNTEYSGMRWSFFFLAEYANLLSASGIAATLFLGGWSGPFLPPFVWFMLKTYLFIFIAMWIRWTVPRLRVDQLMELGWKVLIPLGLLNILITGIYISLR